MKYFLKLFLILLMVHLYASCSTNQSASVTTRNIAQVYNLEKVELPSSIKALLDSEQLLIDRSVDENIIYAPTIEGQALEYRPEQRNWFTLRTIWIPEDELQVAELENSEFNNSNFIKEVDNKRYFRLLIHPESIGYYSKLIDKYEEGGSFLATSTSSSRTVLVTDKKGYYFFAKLSLNVELAGVVRTIPKGEVARSVGYTMLTDKIDSPNTNFHFMRESLGINPKGFERGGQILREIPASAFNNENTIVPLFSLYSKANGLDTILKKMLEGEDRPVKFIEDKILTPFAKAWVAWATDANLVMEAHAQNVLIQLDKFGKPTGQFYHRDLGGVNALLGNVKLSNKLPVFDTLSNDYLQTKHNEAITQSLRIYFEGGFLYNVNDELQRLHNSKVDLRVIFRNKIIKELGRKLGYQLQGLNHHNLYSQLVQIVQTIRRNERPASILRNCFDMIKSFF